MPLLRRRRILIGVVILAILGGGFLWALPEIIRRVALQQIARQTGRAVAIEDIDLNLFTGHLAIKKFRLAERDTPEAFVEFERFDARLVPWSLLRSNIRLAEIALVAPSIRVVRTNNGEFNFSDLLQPAPGAPPPKPAAGPSRWTLTVDRLTVERGAVRALDQMVSPAAEWVVQDFGVDVTGFTTRAGAEPARATVHLKLDEAALDVTAAALRLDPLKIDVKVALGGFEVRRVTPYVFAATPYHPSAGRLGLALNVLLDQQGEELSKAVISGTLTLEGHTTVATGQTNPFISSSRVAIDLKEADALHRTIDVASVAIEGLDAKVRRNAAGVIDVVEMLTAKPAAAKPATPPPAASTSPEAAPAAAPAAAGAAPQPPVQRILFPVLRALARGFELITIEKITLAPSAATFEDSAVTPATTLALTKMQATVTNLTWPPKGPATLAFSTALPGGGTLDVNGPVIPQPLDADLRFKLRDAPVTPYQAYIPVPARLAGRFNGDSRNHVAIKNGVTTLASTGDSWGQDVEISAPGASKPAIRIGRLYLNGIDVDWPKRAGAAKAGVQKLAVDVEREPDGTFDVLRLFQTPGAQAPAAKAAPAPAPSPAPAPAPAAAAPAEAKPKGLLETIALEFKEVRIEQASIRFLDRTVKPAASQDLSQFDLKITNLTNKPGQRAQLTVQSVVGGDAALDVRGELGPIGGPTFIDLAGELSSFKLASVDSYAESATGWVIKKGELRYKFRFKVDGPTIDASNEVVVGKLQVAPGSGGDEVKHRIGLPLGLIVSLLKDGKGEIRATVPVTGSTNDPKFDLSETIWTAIKNVLVNVVKAPFRAIGRLFSSSNEDKLEEPKIDPVTFAAGSSVLAPDMEEHLLRVADFLRRTPFVNLALAPTPSPADVDALRAEATAARLREFQKAKGLKDGPGIVIVYFKDNLAGVKMPPTTEEQLAVLRAREPVPEQALTDLGQRRLDATRNRLVTAEGIPADRLTVAEPKAGGPPPAPGGSGRVEFTVVPRAE